MSGICGRKLKSMSDLQTDNHDAARCYVLVHQETNLAGSDLYATPEVVELDNQRRAILGDPWRWEEYAEAA